MDTAPTACRWPNRGDRAAHAGAAARAAIAVALLGLLSIACDGGTGDGLGGAGGGAGTGGSGGSGGTGGAANPCGLPAATEREPNDARDMATPYVLGTNAFACVGHSRDADHWTFTVPSNPAGGYVEVTLTDVGEGSAQLGIYAASDNGEIHKDFSVSKGQSLSTYFAAAPGQTYRLVVDDFAAFSKAYPYTLKATYTAVDDAFEANDKRADAKAITLATPIMATLFAGHSRGGMLTDTVYQDWYAVTLAGGDVSLSADGSPTDVYLDVELFDSTGRSIVRESATTAGASVSGSAKAVAAGAYTVKVGPFSVLPPSAGRGPELPDHFTKKYRLTVSQ